MAMLNFILQDRLATNNVVHSGGSLSYRPEAGEQPLPNFSCSNYFMATQVCYIDGQPTLKVVGHMASLVKKIIFNSDVSLIS